MKLSRLVEIGAATVIGLNAVLQHERKEEHKKTEHGKSLFKPRHIVLYSSLAATGLAIWNITRHHHAAA